MRRLIENIDTLHTCDDEGRVLRRAWIVVAGSRIAALGDGPPPPATSMSESICPARWQCLDW
jgi:hypothetical protein